VARAAAAAARAQARAASELLDQRHPRASISEGQRILIAPGKVLENIAMAMERVDIDIDTPISIEEDVVPLDELAALVQQLRMGPLLAGHVVNTAMRIMSARYPDELVRAPLPVEYDLRTLVPLSITQPQHEIAKAIFNRRTASATDLADADLMDLAAMDVADQIQVFVILFYMYGTKLGALKYRTGIA
jgi:hypothetical protein